MLGQKFPVQERVAAGVSYTEMLKEFGWAGCYIVFVFVAYAIDEISRVLGHRFFPSKTDCRRVALCPGTNGVVCDENPQLWPAAVRLSAVHHDSARHHRGGHRQLDCRPDDAGLATRRSQRRQLGPGL